MSSSAASTVYIRSRTESAGLLSLLLIPFAASALVDLPRQIQLGAVTASGALNIAQVALAAAGLAAMRAYPRVVVWRFVPYGAFVGWLFMLAAIESPGQAGMQNGFAYLLFGVQFLLAGTFAAHRPDTTVSLLRRGIFLLDAVTLSLVLVDLLRFGLPGDIGDESQWLIGPRSVALLAIIPICWHLAAWCHRRPGAGARAFAWIVVVILSLSRTATAVALVAAAGAFVAQGWITPKLFVRRIPAVAIGGTICVLLILSDGAAFYERFFEGYNSVEVGGVAISTSGRSVIWPLVIESGMQHPIVGGGLGSSQTVLDGLSDSVAHPHNDYLRVWHDGGVIAVTFLLIAFTWWLVVLGRQWVRYASLSLHPEVDLAAFLTLLGIMLAAITDNGFIYPFVMGPSGTLIGAALGIHAFERESAAFPVASQRTWDRTG